MAIRLTLLGSWGAVCSLVAPTTLGKGPPCVTSPLRRVTTSVEGARFRPNIYMYMARTDDAAALATSAPAATPAFWPVAMPPIARDALPLADLLRLAAVAGRDAGKLWTTAPSVPLLDATAPPTAARRLACWPETATLHHVLSPAECSRIVALLEGIPDGFGPGRGVATGPESVRKNDVLVWVAPPPLVAALWARVAPALRPLLGGGGHKLNARLRCYRYSGARRDEFASHHDGGQHATLLAGNGVDIREDTAGGTSRYSLLLYLNAMAATAEAAEVEDGGSDGGGGHGGGDGGGGASGPPLPTFAGGATVLLPGGEAAPAAAVRVSPEAGGGLVFPHGEHRHSLLHAGEAVTRGVKYVLRTDLFV